MYKDNLLINSIETEREKLFNYKCNGLINYYSKEAIIKKCHSLRFITKQFVNDALSYEDVCYFLIKKYYISNLPINDNNAELNMYINHLSFENVHQLLINNPEARQEVFKVYLDNINIPNIELSREKAYRCGYTKTNMTIVELEDFYLLKKINKNNKKNKVLKKSYK